MAVVLWSAYLLPYSPLTTKHYFIICTFRKDKDQIKEKRGQEWPNIKEITRKSWKTYESVC